MKSFVDALHYAQQQSGAGSKSRIQDAFSKLTPSGWRLVWETLNPYRVFNVRKYDWPKEFSNVDAPDTVFFNLLDRLANRDITGNAARSEVTKVMSLCTEETANALRYVLLKDLKAGISNETLNKIHFGDKTPMFETINAAGFEAIPIYSLQLAEKMPKPTDKKQFDWNRALIIDSKLDGQRNNANVQVACGLNSVVHYARSGQISEQYEELFDKELIAFVNEVNKRLGYDPDTNWVVDGETKASSFQETMNAKRKSDTKAKAAINFYIYDIIPLENWKRKLTWGVAQLERLEIIKECIATVANSISTSKLRGTEWKLVSNKSEAHDFYEYLVMQGYEGAVVKCIGGFYEWDRSENWTKWKPVETFDGYITGFYSGRADTSISDVLGGVYIEGVDENGERFSCKVGSGFPKADEGPLRPGRETIWNNQDVYLGKCIEIEADPNVSKKEGREVNALRWGVFIKMRPDKDKI